MITFSNESTEARRSIISQHLQTNVFVIAFTKVDGSRREMPCTLMESLLPVHYTNTDNPVDFPKQSKKFNPAVMSVFCTDKQEWRSFRLDNVLEIKLANLGEAV